jgi:cation:H+ antiporter
VLGSNLLNVLFVVGVVSLVNPLEVEAEAIRLHLPVMLAFGVLLFPLAATKLQLERWEGGVLLAGFIGYTLYLLLPYV